MSTVNVRVSPETRDALNQIGRKGETYDAIIQRLIKYQIKDYDPRVASSIAALLDIEEEAEG